MFENYFREKDAYTKFCDSTCTSDKYLHSIFSCTKNMIESMIFMFCTDFTKNFFFYKKQNLVPFETNNIGYSRTC